MNERQEATADVLGKLTVLGTIVLPMNIITGLWGMNCLVPGQDANNLNWFYGSQSPNPLPSLSLLRVYFLHASAPLIHAFNFPSPLHFYILNECTSYFLVMRWLI